MTTFVTRYSSSKKSSSSQLKEFEELAKEAGVKVPAQSPSFLSRVFSTLNKPSELTEKALVGEQGYSKALDKLGITNTKGKLDANDVASFAARMALDPLNLIPGAAIAKGAKFASKATGLTKAAQLAGKVPAVAKTIDTAGGMFVPGYALSKVSPDLAQKLPALEKMIGAKQRQTVRSVGELFKDTSPKIRDNIGKLVEKAGAGGKLTDEEAEAVQKATQFIKENITDPEKAAGISPKEVANYFPRKAERDAVQSQLKFGGNTLSLSLGGANKARKFETQAAGEKAGVVYKKTLEALGIRASKSLAAVANSKFLGQLIKGEVKDISGNSLLQPLKKGDDVADGFAAVRIDKNGLRVGDKFLGFYPTVSNKGKKIVGVTTRGGNFQVPKEVAPDLERYFNAFVSDDATNTLLKGFDKIMGAWKASVTSLFPAFHARNVLGNLSNMWLGGFNPQDIPKLATAVKIQRGGETVVKGTKVTRDMVEQLGLTGRGQFGADIPGILEKTLSPKSFGQKLASAPRHPFEAGRAVGTAIEDNSKIAFFLQRLGKGDSVEQAVAQTKKYLFDYTSLTPSEQNVMRRVIPFYTWARNNIPLQIESLITKPGRQAAISKSFANLNPLAEEDRKNLPSYLAEGLTANLGKTPEGDTKILYGLGLPIEDVGRLDRGGFSRTAEREIIGAMGPLGNLVSGQVFKRDPYRGKSLSELDYTYGQMAKNYPGFIKKLIGYKETKTKNGKIDYHVDPTKFNILANIAPRVLKSYGDPGSLLDFKKEAVVNREKAKAAREREIADQLAKALQEKGLANVFQKYYIPAETKTKSKYITRY